MQWCVQRCQGLWRHVSDVQEEKRVNDIWCRLGIWSAREVAIQLSVLLQRNDGEHLWLWVDRSSWLCWFRLWGWVQEVFVWVEHCVQVALHSDYWIHFSCDILLLLSCVSKERGQNVCCYLNYQLDWEC